MVIGIKYSKDIVTNDCLKTKLFEDVVNDVNEYSYNTTDKNIIVRTPDKIFYFHRVINVEIFTF